MHPVHTPNFSCCTSILTNQDESLLFRDHYRFTLSTSTGCLASPANFLYGRVEAKVLSHVTFMPVLIRPANNFLGQVIGNASEGKYN